MSIKRAFDPVLTAEYLRSRVDYNPETGLLTWKPIAEKTPIDKMWNKRFAGTVINHRMPSGHIQFRVSGHNLLAHRAIWLIVHGEMPSGILDHANRDPSDNRLCNLREATRTQNAVNSKRRKIGGLTGVWFQHGNWSARVSFNSKRYYLGRFPTAELAAIARDEKAKALHQEFAVLNFSAEVA